jgi:hypothetical protein
MGRSMHMEGQDGIGNLSKVENDSQICTHFLFIYGCYFTKNVIIIII